MRASHIPESCKALPLVSFMQNNNPDCTHICSSPPLPPQVCEECGCEEAVFPLTVNYVDRFLERRPTLRKYQLQLIGVVCLLIASKIRQCKTLSINELCYMTDHSVTPNEILVSCSLLRSIIIITAYFLIHTDMGATSAKQSAMERVLRSAM